MLKLQPTIFLKGNGLILSLILHKLVLIPVWIAKGCVMMIFIVIIAILHIALILKNPHIE